MSDGRVRDLACDVAPVALVVVDHTGAMAMANAAARRLFGLTADDIGRSFEELEVSSRPVELTSALEQVQKEQRPLFLEHVSWAGGPGTTDCLDIHVVPLTDGAGTSIGVALTFIDVSLSCRLREELETTNGELDSTNAELESTIGELEATNAKLESTNAELEVLNAELQSTNEEFQTVNDELRMRTKQLEEVNDLLESILAGQPGGLVVIDRDMRISIWNDRSVDLWGIRPDEAPGQHFLNLDIGLPVEELRRPVQAVLTGESGRDTVELDATNRRGKEFRCRVVLTPLSTRDRQVRGVILLMEEITT